MLSVGNVCEKFGVECWGAKGEKGACPIWTESFEIEYFYQEKLKLITKLEIEKYGSKTYVADIDEI